MKENKVCLHQGEVKTVTLSFMETVLLEEKQQE